MWMPSCGFLMSHQLLSSYPRLSSLCHSGEADSLARIGLESIASAYQLGHQFWLHAVSFFVLFCKFVQVTGNSGKRSFQLQHCNILSVRPRFQNFVHLGCLCTLEVLMTTEFNDLKIHLCVQQALLVTQTVPAYAKTSRRMYTSMMKTAYIYIMSPCMQEAIRIENIGHILQARQSFIVCATPKLCAEALEETFKCQTYPWSGSGLLSMLSADPHQLEYKYRFDAHPSFCEPVVAYTAAAFPFALVLAAPPAIQQHF